MSQGHLSGYPTYQALRLGRVIMHFTRDNVPDSVFAWNESRSRDYSAFSHWSHASSHFKAPIIIPFFFPLAPSFGLDSPLPLCTSIEKECSHARRRLLLVVDEHDLLVRPSGCPIRISKRTSIGTDSPVSNADDLAIPFLFQVNLSRTAPFECN